MTMDNPNPSALLSMSSEQVETRLDAPSREIFHLNMVEDGVPQLTVPWMRAEASFQRRTYRNYEEYVAHQVAKLSKLDLREYDSRYRAVLRERLEKLDLLRRGDTVLCLGARIGTECKAFIDLGCFSVGIDLNPGAENAHVV